MTWYTFGTVPVYDAGPGASDKVVTDATGGKLVLVKDGPAVPIRDLNGTPITEITSNSDGQSSQFQAEVLSGLIQFGELVVTVWANEVAAKLNDFDQAISTAAAAVTASQAAVAAAQQAIADAQAALVLAQQGGGTGGSGGGGGLPLNTTLDDIPNGALRLALTLAQSDKIAALPATFLKVGTAATDAKPGNYSPTPASIHAVESIGMDAQIWFGRTTVQGPPTEAEGAKRGTAYAFLDVVA